MNVCVPANSQIKILNPQGDGVRRRGLWEVIGSGGWSLVNGIRVLRKGTQESSSPLPPYEDTVRRLCPGNGLSPHIKSTSTLILDFPALPDVRNKFLLFVSPTVYCILCRSSSELRQCLWFLSLPADRARTDVYSVLVHPHTHCHTNPAPENSL